MKSRAWICMWALASFCPVQAEDPARKAPANVIGPDDTISITALDCDEIAKSWRVNGSGSIDLPIVGRLLVAGKTVDAVEGELVEKLKPFILEPHVSVFVAERRSRPVAVSGLVVQPGTYQMAAGATLFDAVMAAGGPKDNAAMVTLIRSGPAGKIPLTAARFNETTGTTSADLELKSVMDARSEAANLPVQPKDSITLSAAKEQRMVHIMGEVTKPGAVELVTQPTISITKLLAVAGGLTRTASPKHTRIMHIGPGGIQTEVASVNLKQILDGRVKDLELTAGDIVVIPSSQIMTYFQTASLAAITTGVYILGRF